MVFNLNVLYSSRVGLFDVSRSEALNMDICMRHRDRIGIHWRGRAMNCQIPKQIAWHKRVARGEKKRALQKDQSEYILKTTGKLIPIGAG